MVKSYWIITLLGIPLSWGLYVHHNDKALAILPFLICVYWAIQGSYDMYISRSNLRRLYPVVAHIRYILEYIRPEIHQYFIANNTEEHPFNREERNVVYRRARGVPDTLPFGTEHNMLEDGYLTAEHSLQPKEIIKAETRVLIGGEQCSQPYLASHLNISAMSFGALSANAIRALNRGARLGGFAHNTGEGGISPYHEEFGGDLIWQIGTGHFGCRNNDGSFDSEAFKEKACLPQVKMIEIKLSQGAKPSHGGVLPAVKVSEEIARIRMLEPGKDVISPPSHSSFSTPRGLLELVQRLRELSSGKAVGFKLCLGKKKEFLGICKAMLETGIRPDFITVDGSEGGTGAAPMEFSNRLGTPCLESIYYINQVLTALNLREQIRIIASGKTATGFDMLTKIALGADTVNAARTMMFALGCIQSQSCNTNRCPTGIATQDPVRAKAIDVEEKHRRVASFHDATVQSFLDLCGALGYDDPTQLSPSDIFRRFDQGLMHFDDIYTPLEKGQLLGDDIPAEYATDWALASADRF